MYRVQKKRKGLVFYVILFLCAFSVGLGIGYASIRKKAEQNPSETLENIANQSSVPMAEPEKKPASLTVVAEDPTPQTAQYFVISQDNNVCVFTLDEEKQQHFSHTLNIELEALPAVDRELFAKGIYLYSKQELLELTEDFAS